jgi:hypothetical protein
MIQQHKVASLDEKGLMLLEVVIGAAIFAVLTASIASLFVFVAQSQKNAKGVQAFNDLVSFAQMSLDDEKACTYSLGTVVDSSGSPVAGLGGATLPQIGGSSVPVALYYYDSAQPTQPRSAATPVTHANAGGGSELTTIQFSLGTQARIAPNRFIANLSVTAARNGAGAGVGTMMMHQTFPLYVTTDASGVVNSCYGNYGAMSLADVNQQTCETLMGPDYFFNVTTQRCDTRWEVRCDSPGTRLGASCPAASAGLGGDTCQASGTSDSMTAPGVTPLYTRNYDDGWYSNSTPPREYHCVSVNSYDVKCSYTTDPSVNSSAAICSACCKYDKLLKAATSNSSYTSASTGH